MARVDRPEPGLYVCPSCKRKHEEEYGTEERLKTRLLREWAGGDERAGSPRDLEDIGRGSKEREGYIALLYADVNEAGRRLQSCLALSEFTRLSEDLRRIVKGSLFSALSKLRKEGEGRPVEVWPLEFVILGGDDLSCILLGD